MSNFDKVRSVFLGSINVESIRETIEKKATKNVNIFLVVTSTLLCCIGVNFSEKWVIALSMILYPIADVLVELVYSLLNQNADRLLKSLLKLLTIIVISVVVAILYFFITPFSMYTPDIFSMSRVNISIFFAEILIGIMVVVVLTKNNYIFYRAVLSVISSLLLLLCIVAISLKLGDYVMLQNGLKYFMLSSFFIMLGMIISFLIYSVTSNQDKSIANKAVLIAILIFGLYFGSREIYVETTNFNVNQYVYKELENRSFTVSNIEVSKATKEVVVYYSGVVPALSQDDYLKKKYKLKNYHFLFEKVK